MATPDMVRRGAGAAPVLGNATSGFNPDPVGSLVGFIAFKIADAQLDKIRNRVTDDMNAMKIGTQALETLDRRITELGRQEPRMNQWRDGWYRKRYPEMELEGYYAGQTRHGVYDVTLTLYGALVQRLPEVRNGFSTYQNTGFAAVVEKLLEKLGYWQGKEGVEAERLRAEYNTIMARYWLWYTNVEEMAKIDDAEHLFR